MKFFIDFEAAQPQNEIIAVGAVSEDGATFRALVKPQFSKVNSFITELTGLTDDILSTARPFYWVMSDLMDWVEKRVENWDQAEFYAYGDGDEVFLKTTINHLKPTFLDYAVLGFASYMCVSLKDCSKEIAKYFHRDTVKLVKAFNYVQEQEMIQRHDALEDAMMLRKVFEATNGQQPLTKDPWEKEIEQVFVSGEAYGVVPKNYIFPSGKFYCKTPGSKKEREFENIEQAIDWLISTRVKKMIDPMFIKIEWLKIL